VDKLPVILQFCKHMNGKSVMYVGSQDVTVREDWKEQVYI